MFSKPETPEMDDFKRKLFKKIFWKISKFLTETLPHVFLFCFVSEHSKLFSFWEEKMHFLAAEVTTPPPLADASAKNAIFFDGFNNIIFCLLLPELMWLDQDKSVQEIWNYKNCTDIFSFLNCVEYPRFRAHGQ